MLCLGGVRAGSDARVARPTRAGLVRWVLRVGLVRGIADVVGCTSSALEPRGGTRPYAGGGAGSASWRRSGRSREIRMGSDLSRARGSVRGRRGWNPAGTNGEGHRPHRPGYQVISIGFLLVTKLCSVRTSSPPCARAVAVPASRGSNEPTVAVAIGRQGRRGSRRIWRCGIGARGSPGPTTLGRCGVTVDGTRQAGMRPHRVVRCPPRRPARVSPSLRVVPAIGYRLDVHCRASASMPLAAPCGVHAVRGSSRPRRCRLFSVDDAEGPGSAPHARRQVYNLRCITSKLYALHVCILYS